MHLMQDLLPDVYTTLTHRIVNYLSFYLSHNGKHLYYSPHLYSQQYLQRHFLNRQIQGSRENNEHVLAKMLLATHFQEQIMDVKATFRLMNDLNILSSIHSTDIIEAFLRVKCRNIRSNQPLKIDGKPLAPEKRRNIYVSHKQTLPEHQQLSQIITLNPFYRLPNLNKILIFAAHPHQKLQLTASLEAFCHQNSVKIKLLQTASAHAIVEYIYNKSKGKILIHETLNFDKEIYDLKTPPQKQRTVKNKVINELNTRFMPRQILLFTQRLPVQSLATPQTKTQVLSKMRDLLSLGDGEDLIDPVNRLSMSTIEKNYRNEELTTSSQSKLGFLLKRFVTEQVYAFERKYNFLYAGRTQTLLLRIPSDAYYLYIGIILLTDMNLSMNLSARQYNDNIFSQSMADMALRKNRMLASTGFSNLNSSMQMTRLPQLSRSFSSSKSAKLKLTTIEGTLSAISQQLQELRLDTRESRRYCNFLRDDLGESQLGSLRLDLATTINKFDKGFKLARKNNEDRSELLNKDCSNLRESTNKLKQMVALIQEKIDKCEQTMGVYSGKQKHRV